MGLIAAPPEFRHEVKEIARIAWPVSLTYLCRFAMMLTDSSVLGHLGTKYLAASSLAGVWMMVTFTIVGRPLGEWLQLCLLCMLICCIPVAALWVFTGDVLVLAGTAHETAALAGHFSRISIGWLAPFMLYLGLNEFLAAQKIVFPALLTNLVFVAVNLGLNLVLVFGVHGMGGMGFAGSPLATVLSRLMLVLAYYVYAIRFRKLHVRAWGGWTAGALAGHRVRELLKLALPLAAAAAFEDWQLQIITFMAGRMGDAPVAAHTAMFQLFFVLTSFMYGLATASSVRIGFHVGNADIPAAKTALRACLTLSAGTAAVVAALLGGLYHQIGHVFTSDPEVLRIAAQMAPLVAGCYVFLSLFYTSMAVLDAQGRPRVVAASFFVGAWCIALPLAYVFGFVLDLGVMGLWWALVAGYSVVTLAAGTAVLRSDWVAIVRRAQERQEVHSGAARSLLAAAAAAAEPGAGSAAEGGAATPAAEWGEPEGGPQTSDDDRGADSPPSRHATPPRAEAGSAPGGEA